MYTHIHSRTFAFTHVHSNSLMYIQIHSCTFMFTNTQCLLMYAHVHWCTPIYTHVHSHSLMYADVQSHLLMFTHVHCCTLMFNDVHSLVCSCTLFFTDVRLSSLKNPNLHSYHPMIPVLPLWHYCYAFFVYTTYTRVHTERLGILVLKHASYGQTTFQWEQPQWIFHSSNNTLSRFQSLVMPCFLPICRLAIMLIVCLMAAGFTVVRFLRQHGQES